MANLCEKLYVVIVLGELFESAEDIFLLLLYHINSGTHGTEAG